MRVEKKITDANFIDMTKNLLVNITKAEKDDLQMVWYAHVLGNKKALFMAIGEDFYIEVTHNSATEQFYVDFYEKQANVTISNKETEEQA
jgi:hypothetical protein